MLENTMEQRPLASVRVVTAMVLLVMILATPALTARNSALAQPVAAPRDQLLGTIRDMASRHAGSGSPPQTALVVSLFAENTVGLSKAEIAQLYETEYDHAKRKRNESWGQRGRTWLPWLVALLGIGAAVRKSLEKLASHAVEAAGTWLFALFSGTRLFRKRVLMRYRTSLEQQYSTVQIPFGTDLKLEMSAVFVPLQLERDGVATLQPDSFRAIAELKRVVAIGAPGAGKSMLLRRLMLAFARDELPTELGVKVPVLVRLHRMNESTSSIRDELVAQLERDRFPGAARFLRGALDRGTVMLLFDGLDEVNSARRSHVVSEIQDLVDEHRDCMFVVTCRAAIYKGEFLAQADATLRVLEFNDQQIRLLALAWEKYMPANRSVEHLLRTLRERPRILALARNPLLLTMIAYLYSHGSAEAPTLPHSRAEFYEQATSFLLGRWHLALNRFDQHEKRVVLERLAVFNQEKPAGPGEDRLSIRAADVLDQVRLALAPLNRSESDAGPLLREIVDRTGLLLEIDGGERYQFSHLTLQEYLTSTAIGGDPKRLLERYRTDPDAWRETVKLSCGGEWDSTELIRELRQEDAVLALECLGDARQVDPALADDIIAEFKPQLLMGVSDRVAAAFAAVASDPRPRGMGVFGFLTDTLRMGPGAARAAAAKALSLTNLPRAAEGLGNENLVAADIREALIAMGDVAVPVLRERAVGHGYDDLVALTAAGALASIATPVAACALHPLLWHPDRVRSHFAAWALGVLVAQPGIEAALAALPLTEEQRSGRNERWVWRPFEEGQSASLAIVMGRIAHVLSVSPAELSPTIDLPIDPRLAVPLAAVQLEGSAIAEFRKRAGTGRSSSMLFAGDQDRTEDHPGDERFLTVLDDILHDSTSPAGRVYRGLPPGTRARLARSLRHHQRVTIANWEQLRRPVKYDFDHGWHYRFVLCLLVAATLTSAVTAFSLFQHSRSWLRWLALAGGVWVLIASALPLSFGNALNDSSDIELLLEAPQDFFSLGPDGIGIVLVGWWPGVTVLVPIGFRSFLPWPGALGVSAASILVALTVWRAGKQRQRVAGNPLHGVLDETTSAGLTQAAVVPVLRRAVVEWVERAEFAAAGRPEGGP